MAWPTLFAPRRSLVALLRITTLAACGLGGVCAQLAESPRSAPAEHDQYREKTWSRESGLPQVSVTSLARDSDGYLWIGTFGGLVRFDGFEFQCFTVGSHPALTSNRVTALLSTPDGTLWIGTEGRGVLRMRDGDFEHFAPGNRAPDGVVRTLVLAPDGEVWAAGTRVWVMNAPDGPRPIDSGPGPIRDLIIDRDGAGWACTPGHLYRIEAGKLHLWADDFDPWSVAEFADGRIVVSGSPHWRVYDATDRSAFVNAAEPLARANLRRVHCPKANSIAVLKGDRIQLLQDFDAEGAVLRPLLQLTNDEFRCALAWSADSMWLGTDLRGLKRLTPTPVRNISRTTTGQAPPVDALAVPRKGSPVFASSGQLYAIKDGIAVLNRSLKPPGLMPHHVAVDKEGRLVFADSAYVTDPSGYGPLVRRHDIGRLTALGVDGGGVTWIAGTNGIARSPDFKRELSLPSSGVIKDFVRGPDRTWWYVSDRGFGRIADGRCHEFGTAELPSWATIRDLEVRPNGAIWLTTYGHGMVRYREGQVRALTVSDGLPCDSLQGMVTDQNDQVWVNSNIGVFSVPWRDLEALADDRSIDPRFSQFQTGEGTAQAALRDSDGKLWFATVHGPACIDPSKVRTTREIPKPVIRNLLLNQVHRDPSSGFELPPGPHSFRIDYGAVALEGAEMIRFRYRLRGLSDRWIDAGRRRDAVFTNLAPNAYTFEVQASAQRGAWAPATAVLSIDVRPRFWQTTWFSVLAILSLLASVGLGFKARLKGWATRTAALEREIDNRKRIEEERRRLELRLREQATLEALGRLAGSVAHDFNNVTMAIMVNAELLDEFGEEIPDEAREHAQEIVDCATRAGLLTRQLLAFCQPQSITRTEIDLHEILLRLEPMVRRLLPAGVVLDLDSQPGRAWVSADPNRIEQLIVNLLLNARDAVASGGHISMRVRAMNSLADSAEPSWISIEVEDDGEGIPDEVLPHIFDPFFTSKRGRGGSGLGLATVRSIAEAIDGSVSVERGTQVGSKFIVKLPLIEGPKSHPASPTLTAATPRPTEAKTILLCDDFAPGLSSMASTLRGRNYVVFTAEHADEAQRIMELRGGAVDLLVTDVILPHRSGPELASDLHRRWPELKVLFVTGYAPTEILQQGSPGDHAQVLHKPFTGEALLAAVHDTLSGARRQDDQAEGGAGKDCAAG